MIAIATLVVILTFSLGSFRPAAMPDLSAKRVAEQADNDD